MKMFFDFLEMKKFFAFLLISVEQLNYEIVNLQMTEMQPELRTILIWLLVIYKQIIVSFALVCNFILELFLTLLRIPFLIALKCITKIEELSK